MEDFCIGCSESLYYLEDKENYPCNSCKYGDHNDGFFKKKCDDCQSLCACGPWHDSRKEPPPSDGKELLGLWEEIIDLKSGPRITKTIAVGYFSNPNWVYHDDFITDKTPTYWAEIRNP